VRSLSVGSRGVSALALRAMVGGGAALIVASSGVAVGLARASLAPADAPPQTVLGPQGSAIVARYALGFVTAGIALGVLWPVRSRSRGASAMVGAVAGALFGALTLPAMAAALPNWPVGAGPMLGPDAWLHDLLGGLLAGVVLGWGFPLRRADTASTNERSRVDPPVV
jgi:hypothetical protein